jgi:RHS repeat-associated protein
MQAWGYSGDSQTLPKTRVWGSEPENLHCSSATAPLKIELRWGCEASSEKTAVGSGVSFKYDPFGRRIYKSSSTATSVYAYDGDNLVEETNSSGTAVARYSQGLHIDELLAMLRSSTTSYYEADGLGSITSLSNAAGALAQTYTLDSFGNQTASSGSLTNSFRYTGRELDTETNLYFYRARYYDPTAGRFISEDPLGVRVGINRFQYVANAPTNFVDPSGLCKISVGHHSVLTMLPTCGPPIKFEHTYIVIGDTGNTGKGSEPWVFDSQPNGPICPWCKPTLEAAAGPLIPGLPETNTVNNDGTPLLVTADDGRPCQLDQRILDDFANKLNAAGVPYHLLGPNSNSATSSGLNALGINGWNPPIIAPGWGTPLPIPK